MSTRPSEQLTTEEWRTYQSLIAREMSPEDALEGALDGVHVDDVRRRFR